MFPVAFRKLPKITPAPYLLHFRHQQPRRRVHLHQPRPQQEHRPRHQLPHPLPLLQEHLILAEELAAVMPTAEAGCIAIPASAFVETPPVQTKQIVIVPVRRPQPRHQLRLLFPSPEPIGRPLSEQELEYL